MDVLALGEVLVGELRLDAEGVGTEVVTLSLQQVGGQVLGAVAVVEAEGSSEGGQRDTPQSRLADNVAPAGLSLVDSVGEELVEQQVLEVGVLAVGVGDVLQEDGADNAATTPHESNGRLVELPLVLLGGVLDEHEALGVGDDLGGIQSLLEVINESGLVARELGSGALQDSGSTATLILESRQATGEDSLTDQGDGHAEVQSVDGSPLAGTLLASLVEDLLDEGSAVVVVIVEDIAGDLDKERVEDTGVPLGENVTNLLARETKTALEDVVGLIVVHQLAYDTLARDPASQSKAGAQLLHKTTKAYLTNQLHVAVLDTVVNHLDVVASTLVTDPVTAGLAVALGGDALEDILDVGPGVLVTTGHEGGTVAGTLLTTGDTAADEADALLTEVVGAAVAVGVVGVTTVNDDITLLQEGEERLDEVIDGLAGHDEEHNATRALELGAELLNGVSTDDRLAYGGLS